VFFWVFQVPPRLSQAFRGEFGSMRPRRAWAAEAVNRSEQQTVTRAAMRFMM
jgi:hypothetical protein